jgi:hypothetical protein
MRKKLLFGLGCAVLLVIGFLAALPLTEKSRLHAPERKQWKEQALARINAIGDGERAVPNEIAEIRAEITKGSGDGWIGASFLLMTNGEFLAYSDINAKEDGRIQDLFLARGSDRKWYYSTYHFCVGMVSIRGDDQPASIAEFSSRYFLREFDGRSDECLEKTWPMKK